MISNFRCMAKSYPQQFQDTILLTRRGGNNAGSNITNFNGFLANAFQCYNNIIECVFSGCAHSIGVKQRFELLLHMPHHVISRHADKNMAFDPVIFFVINRSDFKAHSFNIAECLFDLYQSFALIRYGKECTDN